MTLDRLLDFPEPRLSSSVKWSTSTSKQAHTGPCRYRKAVGAQRFTLQNPPPWSTRDRGGGHRGRGPPPPPRKPASPSGVTHTVSAYLIPGLVVATQLILGQPPPGREGGALKREGLHPAHRGGTHPHLTQGLLSGQAHQAQAQRSPSVPHTHTHTRPALAASGLVLLPSCHQTSSPSRTRLAWAPMVLSLILSLDTACSPLQGPARPPQAFQHSQASPECLAPGRTPNDNPLM